MKNKYEVIVIVLLMVVVSLIFVSCKGTPPQGQDIVTGKAVTTTLPESDSGIAFVGGLGLPTDQRVYHISGKVVSDVESVTRQVSPARGSLYGGSYGNGYGYLSGTFSGEVLKGKTLIRLQVYSIDPSDTDWITVTSKHDKVVIIKATDLKGLSLYVGDMVSFTCRRQAESVAAINQEERFNPDTYVTWELDYCRLTAPVIGFETQ